MTTSGKDAELTESRKRFRYISMSLMLAVQLLIIFGIGPLLSLGIEISPMFAGSILLTFIFVVILAEPKLVPTILVVGALLFDAAATWLFYFSTSSNAVFWVDGIGSLLSILGLSWIVGHVVFSSGRIDGYRIIGVIILYLNVALLFEVLYRMVEGLIPDAFVGLEPDLDRTRSVYEFMYFSITTLTTVGYGDISPVHPIARSLTNLQGLFGQLYPAIIIARVMTLYRPAE